MRYFCLYAYSTPVEIRNHSCLSFLRCQCHPPPFLRQALSGAHEIDSASRPVNLSLSSAPWSRMCTMTLNFFLQVSGGQIRVPMFAWHMLDQLSSFPSSALLFWWFRKSYKKSVALKCCSYLLIYARYWCDFNC